MSNNNMRTRGHQRLAAAVQLLLFTICVCSNQTNAFVPVPCHSKRVERCSRLQFGFRGGHHVSPALFALEGGSTGDDSASMFHKFSANVAKFQAFASKNFFLLGMFVAVGLARAFPWLGKNGGVTRPELFIGKFGVMCIFLLSGLSLELSELKQAAANLMLNGAIQLTTFGAWPFLVGLPLTTFLARFLPNLLPPALLDGLLILTCLPTTVNMCIILTSAAGGNVATALCNAVISNLLGVFVTPALLLHFFGKEIHLPFVDMVIKLCNKVLLPVAVGQALRATPAKEFYTNNSKKFKRLQELVLLGIVWNAFCNTFTEGLVMELRHALALLALIPSLHLGALVTLKKVFEQPFWGFTHGEVVAAMFTGSQKTLAFGLPLINTIFDGIPNLAAYCAPIMFVHPLQLILGSFLIPKLAEYTQGDPKSA